MKTSARIAKAKSLNRILVGFFVLILSHNILYAQWQSTGNHIYNTNTENIGVGTSNPEEKLHVSGGDILMDNGRFLKGLRNNGSTQQVFGMDSNNDMILNRGSIVHGQASRTIIGFGGAGKSFDVRNENNQTFLRILNDGKVGIGATNPTERLEVTGTVKATAFVGDGSQLTGLNGNSQWDDVSGGINYAEGNVGIGATNPSESLEVFGNARAHAFSTYRSNGSDAGTRAGYTSHNDLNHYVQMEVRGSAETGQVFGISLANTAYVRATNVSNFILGSHHSPLLLATGASERMRITLDGNIGIGTNTPNHALVVGDDFGPMSNQHALAIGSVDKDPVLLLANDATNYSNVAHQRLTNKLFITNTVNSTTVGKIVLDDNGNTGIGTENPTEALDVIGTIKATAFIGDGSQLTNLPGGISYTAGTGININASNVISNTGDTDASDDITNSTPAGGDLTGTYPNPTIGTNAITTSKVLDGAITGSKIASMSASGGQVLKWNGSQWAPGTDDAGGSASPWVQNGSDIYYMSGDVGIGTTNPGSELHVDGDIEVSDDIDIGDKIQFEGGLSTYVDFNATNIDIWVGGTRIVRISDDDFRIDGDFEPIRDNLYDMGASYARWDDIYATNGTINTSDKRDKENIRNLHYGLKEIKKLRPVSFTWKGKPEKGTKLGLIAQELQAVLPEVVKDPGKEVQYDKEGEVLSEEDKKHVRLGVYYSDLIPVLIHAIQEQQHIIEEQKEKVAQLSMNLDEVKQSISLCCAERDDLHKQAPDSDAEMLKGIVLFQNTPNPFNERTSIRYEIPDHVAEAMISIYNMNGVQLKSYDIKASGHGHIQIESQELKPGMYLYSLIVNGTEADTKRMIVTD